MPDGLILLYMTALPLMGGPGPATLSLAATGSVYGFRGGVPWLIGLCCGTSTVLLMIATGVTGLLFALPGVLPVVSILALGYILWLAWKIATAPILSGDVEITEHPSAFAAWLFGIANPKAYAAIGAVFSSVMLWPDDPVFDSAMKVVALVAVVIFVNTVWLAGGAALSRYLRHPKTGRIINICFSVLLVISVIFAALL